MGGIIEASTTGRAAQLDHDFGEKQDQDDRMPEEGKTAKEIAREVENAERKTGCSPRSGFRYRANRSMSCGDKGAESCTVAETWPASKERDRERCPLYAGCERTGRLG